jgi:hypothetical protein
MKVRTAHVSMEVFDNDKQQQHDVEKIFARARVRRYAWITGTESGAGSNLGRKLIDVGKDSGYRLWVPAIQGKGPGHGTDGWIAVRSDLIKGDWKPDVVPVIPGANVLYRKNDVDPDRKGLRHWSAKGVVSVSFDTTKPQLARNIGVGVSHHLTGGRFPNDNTDGGVNHYEWNEKLDHAVSEWMEEAGRGGRLAFFNCDRNASDRRNNQEIAGATTLADELKKWQPTGHGDIDWMLSYDRDGRVSGDDFVVYDDKEFFLNTDHYFCEGVFNVTPNR